MKRNPTESAMAYQDSFTQVDGLKTRCRETGSGPWVVCLHGASLGSSVGVLAPATLLKEQFPQLVLLNVDNCNHLVQRDAVAEFRNPASAFLPG